MCLDTLVYNFNFHELHSPPMTICKPPHICVYALVYIKYVVVECFIITFTFLIDIKPIALLCGRSTSV